MLYTRMLARLSTATSRYQDVECSPGLYGVTEKKTCMQGIFRTRVWLEIARLEYYFRTPDILYRIMFHKYMYCIFARYCHRPVIFGKRIVTLLLPPDELQYPPPPGGPYHQDINLHEMENALPPGKNLVHVSHELVSGGMVSLSCIYLKSGVFYQWWATRY